MPFCYSPWTNIDISPSGNLSPCCKYQLNETETFYNIKQCTIDEYKNSEFLNNIKNTFKQNNWPPGCQRCQIEEQNGIESKRLLDYTRWQDHYGLYDIDTDGFITASIAFGNTCNLNCITCSPLSSSRWQKEYEVIYGKKILPFHFYKNDFVNDFVRQAPNIIHVDIPGGEPFLSGVSEQKTLLTHYVENQQAEKISLHYTTNATLFPDESWWQLWKHFKEVDIQLSLDGVDNRFEYIRHPAKWAVVSDNVKAYQQQANSNIRLSVSHTVSAYNVYYLGEFLSWAKLQELPDPWIGRVHNPIHMRPTVWSQPAKERIIDKLQQHKNHQLQPWIDMLSTVDDSTHFNDFCGFLKKHDQYRNLNFKSVFPELADLI